MLGETPRHTTAHTLLLLQQLDCLQLFDDVRKCIRNDCDHDEEGEDEDQDCRHDRLDVLPRELHKTVDLLPLTWKLIPLSSRIVPRLLALKGPLCPENID